MMSAPAGYCVLPSPTICCRRLHDISYCKHHSWGEFMPIISRWHLKMRGNIGSESAIQCFFWMPLLTIELLKKTKTILPPLIFWSNYPPQADRWKQEEQSTLASMAQKESLLPVCLLPSRGRLHLGLCISDTGAGIAQGPSEGFLLFQQ